MRPVAHIVSDDLPLPQPARLKQSKRDKAAISPRPVHIKTEPIPPSTEAGDHRQRRKETPKAPRNIADSTVAQITSIQAEPETQVPSTPIQLDSSSKLSELSHSDNSDPSYRLSGA